MIPTPNSLVKYGCVLVLSITTSIAHAGFSSYVIREGGGNAPAILPNNVYVPGATEFVIAAGGQKAAWGSDDMNGSTIGDIASVAITRYDDPTRFSAGSGPAVAPYFNIWITDGNGNYAVAANEPSNASFQPLFETVGSAKVYDLSFNDISAEPVQIYETPGGGYGATGTWVHNLVGINGPLTFADIASLVIEAPDAAYITNGANAVGSGAPDELGTNAAYGFNWVFGDTLSNYVSGNEGYVVGNPAAVAIPEPTALVLLGIGMVSLLGRRK